MIRNLIKPYLLRRDLSIMDKAVPPKKEFILRVNMTQSQAQVSKWIVGQNSSLLSQFSQDGVKLTNILMQLKKVCNHTYMFKESDIENMSLDDIVTNSGKMQLLDQLLQSFIKEGNRTLIFTQLLKTMDIIARYC